MRPLSLPPSLRLSHALLASLATLVLLTALADPRRAAAQDFGGVGVGTQLVVVDGDEGNQTGFGFDVRLRFLWVLGLDFSATRITPSAAVWGPSAYRVGLMIHAVTTDRFNLYLSPGLAGDAFGDAFNPVGDTTWYRLGGGFEVRMVDGLALGLDIHWTVPGEGQVNRYVAEEGERLYLSYLEGMGYSAEVPAGVSAADYADLPQSPDDLSTSELLDILPLDRFEYSVALRYYF